MTATHETINGKGFHAEVIRTNRRKTASVRVEEGKVSVVVPQDLSNSGIEELVAKKTRWIREKLLLQRQSVISKPKEYVSGESFTYLGRNYRLKLEDGAVESVKLKNGRLIVALPRKTVSLKKIRDMLSEWYRLHAEQKLQDKAERYAKIIGVSPRSVGVRSFKSRWGSCHVNGDIQFSWKIIIAPNRIVDYVVVHELCHMKHHDHSPKFWKSVERVIPDYLECKEWLKDNGCMLEI